VSHQLLDDPRNIVQANHEIVPVRPKAARVKTNERAACFTHADHVARRVLRYGLRIEEDVERHANVSADLSQQDRRNITSCVHRNRGPSTIGVAELFV